MSDGAQTAGRTRPANRLLERDAELAAIDALVGEVAGGESRLLLVEGPAGIGKSRLVAETRRRAAAAGIAVRSSRGSELERDFPFGVVRQLFEADVLDPHREALLGGAAAAARPIFASVPGSQDEVDASFAALHGLYWLTVNLADDRPLMLVVDDLHWCDRPSLRFLAYLVRRLEGLPISVVASLRPAEPGVDAALIAELTTDPIAVSLRPMALSADASSELIGARLGTEPARAFADLCHAATGGNPLLLSELLKALQAEGVQPDAAHADVVQEIGPRAASRAVLVRLSRLPDQAVDVARSLAVLGDGADLAAVAALAGVDRASAAEAIGELARVEIVRSDTPLGFVHPLVRAAVYTDLPAARREECHARAARILADAGVSACEVAAQLIPTPGRGDPWVVETLEAAARTALGQGAPDSAAAYLNRALEEPPAPQRRPEFLLRVGATESMIDGPASLEHLRAAYETASDPLQRAQAAATLAPIMFFLGMTAEGAAVAERGMADLGPDHRDLRLQLEATRLIQALWDPDSMVRNDPVFTRYRTESLGDGPGARLLAGATAYHWAMTGGPAAECVKLARHATGDGVLVRVANGAIPYVGGQLVLLYADADDGLEAVTQAFRAAHESGALFAAIPTRLFRGLGLALRGELAEAEQLERAAMHDNDVWGFVSVRLFPGSLLAHVLIERGDLAGAAEALAHANPDNAPMPETTNSAFWIGSRLRLLVASGALEEALEVADDCRSRFASTVANPAWLPWRSLAAEALHRLGRRDEALELAHEELALARNWGAPGTVSRALRVLGSVLRQEGLPNLDEAVAITEGTPARLEHAKALTALGTGLRLARRPTDARAPLRRALDLATVFDATVLAERARTELQATGARPRTEALSGVAALTASERRVAEAAAAGQSNKDIAQALYVTPKTIEVHLSNAYRKLGIRSRRELTGALAA
jgi:DNA-binding CsgD family transcriptional regulator